MSVFIPGHKASTQRHTQDKQRTILHLSRFATLAECQACFLSIDTKHFSEREPGVVTELLCVCGKEMSFFCVFYGIGEKKQE